MVLIVQEMNKNSGFKLEFVVPLLFARADDVTLRGIVDPSTGNTKLAVRVSVGRPIGCISWKLYFLEVGLIARTCVRSEDGACRDPIAPLRGRRREGLCEWTEHPAAQMHLTSSP